MKCPECGTLGSDEDLFCGECGAILAAPPADAPAESPAPGLSLPQALPAPSSEQPFSAAEARDTRATAAFVLGLLSVATPVIACLPILGQLFSCIGPVLGIIAVILGSSVKRDIEARGGSEGDWKRAHQGLILGIVGLAIYAVFLVLGIMLGIGTSFLD
jgi:cytochrome c biogenesis protein CcdA